MTAPTGVADVVIPARGGSVSIPGKNAALVDGRPMLVRAVQTSTAARTVGRVFVSTDSDQLAQLATSGGAVVVARPDDLAGPDASTESAVLHALTSLDRLAEVTCIVQCTSPMLMPADVDAAVDLLWDHGYDAVFTACEVHEFLWRRDSTLRGVNHDPSARPLRQHVVPDLRENGAVYAMRTTGFQQARHRFFGTLGVSLMPPERSIDVDEPWELAVADALARRQSSR
ncbi:MAG: cytidylyltransferase domain-containing protein [Acidimicrobiales bacterium]